MSGHSKWSKVKHQKETSDAAKGKLFTKLSNAIITAVREGGGIADSEGNFKLRLAIEKARSLNMPKENIERAIERGKGSPETSGVREVIYEAFGPGGVAILIVATTDNKQRTVAAIKNILERGGGTLAGSGAVAYLFRLMGLIRIRKGTRTIDELMEIALEAQAVDLEDSEDSVEVYTEPAALHKIKEILVEKGIPVESFELFYRPTTSLPVQNKDTARAVLKLLSNLEEIDDVQRVFANLK